MTKAILVFYLYRIISLSVEEDRKTAKVDRRGLPYHSILTTSIFALLPTTLLYHNLSVTIKFCKNNF